MVIGDGQLEADEQDFDAGYHEEEDGQPKVHDPYLLVIDGRDPLQDTLVVADAQAG